MPAPRLLTRLSIATALLWSAAASAHFQEILPSVDRLGADNGGEVVIDLVFTHPMDRGPVMEMKKPERFGVRGPNGVQDLMQSLKPRTVDGKTTWQASYRAKEPGAYTFFVEPMPYWEPAEEKSIIHYAKVVLDGFDWGADWDEPVGLPVEILPLTRPYGLWTGNVFQGIVVKDGNPVPGAEVEVEWVNDGSITPPTDAHVTQVVKADANGVFTYGLPRAGWWGFAALVDGDQELPSPDGKMAAVELGGLLWVRVVDMK